MRIASAGTAALPSPTAGQPNPNLTVPGDLPEILTNEPLAAVVKAVEPGRAILDTGGMQLTVAVPDDALKAGDRVTVRFTESGRGTVDLGDGRTTTVVLEPSARPGSPAPPTPPRPPVPSASYAPATPRPTLPVFNAPVVRAEVLEPMAEGQYRVRIDGRELVVTSEEPLPIGEPVVRRVAVAPTGVTLRPLPDTPRLPLDVASTVLRATADHPALGPALAPLARATGDGPAVQVSNVISQIIPADGDPPTAQQLAAIVEHGGQLYEAKLARAVESRRPAEALRELSHTDLKAALLRAVEALSPTGTDGPYRSALDSVEALQAVNVLAQGTGEGIRLQFPLVEAGQWRTVDVTLRVDPAEADDRPPDGQPPPRRGYSLLMHTELTEFGATWIDAQIAGRSLRGTLYVEREAVRPQVRAELGSLAEELHGLGYSQVSLDVRGTADLPAREQRRAHALQAGVSEGVSLLDVRA